MAFELVDNRNRAIGVAATLGINGLLLVLLLTLSNGIVPPGLGAPGLTTFDVTQPPPPTPPPAAKPAGAAAPPSRGATRAPSPLNTPRPLPKPTPAQPAIDAGSQSASGAGAAAGSGAGQGGQGTGTGAGGNGNGNGSGMATPPVHIAGALSDADYARSGLPRGAQGTVVIHFTIRSDGSVDGCSTVRSSGYEAIDRATCQLVEQRFRFRPARDTSGRAIDYAVNTDFTWRPR